MFQSSAVYKVVYSLVFFFKFFLLVLETLFRFQVKQNRLINLELNNFVYII